MLMRPQLGDTRMQYSPAPDPVLMKVREEIMDLSLNRPAKKNALTREMYLSLVDGLKSAAADEAVHVVVLRAEGDCFCAGNDLVDFSVAAQDGLPRPGRLFLDTLSTFTKPIVAAVNGPAVGIGTTMLLHCDLVYAGSGASFSVPFVNLGLCPEGASSLLLPGTIGLRRAAEMLLLGAPISAPTAKEYGLINDLFPDESLLAEVFNRARQLAEQPLPAILLTKRLLRESRLRTVAETIDVELSLIHI